MATFYGGSREVADHRRPRVRLIVDSQGVRLGPWLPFGRRFMPTYVFQWTQVERIEPLPSTYLSGPAVRFVLRAPVAPLLGSPAAGRWPDARQPVFLCGSAGRLQRVLASVAGLVSAEPGGTAPVPLPTTPPTPPG